MRVILLIAAFATFACDSEEPAATTGGRVAAVAQALEDRLHECGDRRRDIAEDFTEAACGPGGLDCSAPAPEWFDLEPCLDAMAAWPCEVPGIPSECYPLWRD